MVLKPFWLLFQPQGGVMPGYCFRISTGAPLPPGADAVVQVEDTELVKEADEGKTELEINVLKAPSVGQDIRCASKRGNGNSNTRVVVADCDVRVTLVCGMATLTKHFAAKPILFLLSCRPIGFDIEKNAKILEKGQKLGPSELGLLATVGVTKVPCFKRPTIGVMSTGNEVRRPRCAHHT